MHRTLLIIVALLGYTLIAAAPPGPNTTDARAAYRAWYDTLAAAPKPALTRHGLVATEIGRWPVRGANQGVAVDADYFYGIGNFVIEKYDKRTGERVSEWIGLKGGPIIHLNGGYVDRKRLIIAHSNFPQLPMASSLEIHDTRTLAPIKSLSLGIRLGSLTWAEQRDGFWWACFANYNDSGTTPGFDNRWTHVGKFNDDWQMIESWTFPVQVVAAWGRSACSGGSWGDDGLLYVTGHDEKELYVLRLPRSGVTLEYVTTIDVPFAGQSWAWDRSAKDQRVIYGIARNTSEVIAARIPELPAELLK